jgi:hypothetical protein
MTWYIFDIQQTLDIIISFMYGKRVPIRVELFACGKTFLGLNF